jgi:hypothetical protein
VPDQARICQALVPDTRDVRAGVPDQAEICQAVVPDMPDTRSVVRQECMSRQGSVRH